MEIPNQYYIFLMNTYAFYLSLERENEQTYDEFFNRVNEELDSKLGKEIAYYVYNKLQIKKIDKDFLNRIEPEIYGSSYIAISSEIEGLSIINHNYDDSFKFLTIDNYNFSLN